MKNLIEVATDAANFSTLLSAFQAAGIIGMLRVPGQYTVFAPTDAAFRRLPRGALDLLFKDPRTLKPFLCNHIVRGMLTSRDILPGEIQPLEGKALRASLDGSRININDSQIVQGDLRASNGILHAVFDVLVPLRPMLGAAA